LINENMTVGQAQAVVAADMDGEAVMMGLTNGKYYGLGNVGSRIWVLIAHPCPVAAVVDSLIAEYDVERQQCLQDTVTFLQRLVGEGLARVV